MRRSHKLALATGAIVVLGFVLVIRYGAVAVGVGRFPLTVILEPDKGAGIANVRYVTWHDEEEVGEIIHQAEEVLAASPAYDHLLDVMFFEDIEGFNGRQFTIYVRCTSKTWSLEEFGRCWYHREISYWQPDWLVVLVEFEDGRRTVVRTRIPPRGEAQTVRLRVPKPTSP